MENQNMEWCHQTSWTQLMDMAVYHDSVVWEGDSDLQGWAETLGWDECCYVVHSAHAGLFNLEAPIKS